MHTNTHKHTHIQTHANSRTFTHTNSITREIDATGDIAFFARNGSRTEIHQLTGSALVLEETFIDRFGIFGRIDFVTNVTIVIPDLHHHTMIGAFASPLTFDTKQTFLTPSTKVAAFASSAKPSRHFQILN